MPFLCNLKTQLVHNVIRKQASFPNGQSFSGSHLITEVCMEQLLYQLGVVSESVELYSPTIPPKGLNTIARPKMILFQFSSKTGDMKKKERQCTTDHFLSILPHEFSFHPLLHSNNANTNIETAASLL